MVIADILPVPFIGFDVPQRQDIVLSIVIPVYNERETLPRIMRAAMLVAPEVAKEFVVVDDCSLDGSREWLTNAFPEECQSVKGVRIDNQGRTQFLSPEAVCAEPEGRYELIPGQVTVRPVLHKTNGGKGRALRTGFAAATGDVIAIQDADLEYNPADLVPMLYLFQIGVADVVYGSRFYGRPHRVLYFYHYLGNRTISALFNVLFNLNLTDIETGYKMFRREVIEGLCFTSDDFGIEVELSAAFARAKRWRIYEIGISYYGRTYVEGKKIGWRDGIKALWYVIKFRFWRSRRAKIPPY
jgi:glycosyltransferase involved in cell wall biosynthesis